MRRFFLLLFLTGAVAACGGGGGAGSGQVAPPTTPTHGANGSKDVSMKIFIPASQASPAAKRAQYIAPGTQSVRIRVYTINGATPSPQPPDTIAQIGPNAPGCTVVSTGVSCTVIVSVPINPSVQLEILSFSSIDGSGTPLAQGFVTVDTTQVTITPPPVALGGVVGSLIVSPTATSPAVSTSGLQTFTFTVTVKDTNGNVIIPPGTYSPSIFFSASNDPHGAISFSPNPLAIPAANGTNTITLTYDPTKSFSGSSTITAAANTVTQTLTFSPTGSGTGGLTAGYRVFEYTIPTANSKPWSITAGPDTASLWFTENGAEKFGAIFPSTCTQTATPMCTILEGSFPQTTGATMPTGIAAGPNGLMWIGGTNSSPQGHLWTVQSGTCSSSSQTSLSGCTVTAQPDPVSSPAIYQIRNTKGNMLYLGIEDSTGAGWLAQIAPLTQPTPYVYKQSAFPTSPPTVSQVFDIDSNGLATDAGGNNVVALGCGDCSFLTVHPFQMNGRPQGIINTATGLTFVADAGNSQIVYFDPSSCTTTCTYVPINTLTALAQPEFLAMGPDGNIYFTEFAANKIGVLNPSTMTMLPEIPIPTASAGPLGIALGPDGNIWFTELNAGKIGVVVP